MSERVCREVAALLQRAGKGGGGNQHLAAALFNHLLRQYATVRMEIATKLHDTPATDVSALFVDDAGVVGDVGSGMFMAERRTGAAAAEAAKGGVNQDTHDGVLNRRKVALLLSSLSCMTECAGSSILRSAGSCLRSIGLLLSACTADSEELNDADAELVSVCLSLLTAMVMGRVALSGGGDVRELKALLPVLQRMAAAPLQHLSDMAQALAMSILTYSDDDGSGTRSDAAQELRGRLHTCSVMALEAEAAFRGGALVDAAHALKEAPPAVVHRDILTQTIDLALSLLNDEDSFVYTASIQLLAQCASSDGALLGRRLWKAISSADREAAYTLKLLEAWKASLPAMGQSLVGLAPRLLQHSLQRAATRLPRHCDGELDIRAAYLSVSGDVCLQLCKLGVAGERTALSLLQSACRAAVGAVLRPPSFPSPAAAARGKQQLLLMQNAAAYCLYCLVQCLSPESLGGREQLRQAAELSGALREAISVAARKHGLQVAAGHLQFADQVLRAAVERSLFPVTSSKPSVQIGLRGSSILSR